MWEVVNRPRVWSALELSFRAALVASLFNLVFGVLLAWVLVRYRFPGKRLIDAAVDLPFALPTAVAGIALTAIYAPNGVFGSDRRDLRHPRRLYRMGHLDRADLRGPALRRAHRPAGDRGDRPRDRGGQRHPRRQPPAHAAMSSCRCWRPPR
jgi:hypothetical protein